jgi:hypothetical protein
LKKRFALKYAAHDEQPSGSAQQSMAGTLLASYRG